MEKRYQCGCTLHILYAVRSHVIVALFAEYLLFSDNLKLDEIETQLCNFYFYEKLGRFVFYTVNFKLLKNKFVIYMIHFQKPNEIPVRLHITSILNAFIKVNYVLKYFTAH